MARINQSPEQSGFTTAHLLRCISSVDNGRKFHAELVEFTYSVSDFGRSECDPLARPYDLPAMRALVCFEAAARHQSFKLAACELTVTPAAVSHQIKALETELARSFVAIIGALN